MVLLAEWNFGILQHWTSEEGLPLFKEKVAEYLPPHFFFFLFLFFFFEAAVCKKGKAFRIRVFSVKISLGIYGLRPLLLFHGVSARGLRSSFMHNNNNNVHLPCAHQHPERSHDTY